MLCSPLMPGRVHCSLFPKATFHAGGGGQDQADAGPKSAVPVHGSRELRTASVG